MNIENPIIMKTSEDDIKHTTTDISFTESRVSDSEGHIIIDDPNQMENISDFSILKDEAIKARNIEDHQRCNSLDENTENYVISLPKHFTKRKKMKRSISSRNQGGTTCDTWCSKMLLIFGVCCIIGCFLIPFVAYNVTQTRGRSETEADYSHDKNISSAKVCTLLTLVAT